MEQGGDEDIEKDKTEDCEKRKEVDEVTMKKGKTS